MAAEKKNVIPFIDKMLAIRLKCLRFYERDDDVILLKLMFILLSRQKHEMKSGEMNGELCLVTLEAHDSCVSIFLCQPLAKNNWAYVSFSGKLHVLTSNGSIEIKL